MNHFNSAPGKKAHSKRLDAFLVPESDIVYLEREVAANFDEPVSFEIYPDFSHDRSQKHFQVSPEPPRQTPTDTEFYIPVASPIVKPPVNPPRPEEQATASTYRVRYVPEHVPAPRKTPPPAASPEEKALFFSSVASEDTHTLDSALVQLICSEPLLSEEDLLILLKEKLPNLNKHELKDALIRNGLETDYKRFRAYMAG